MLLTSFFMGITVLIWEVGGSSRSKHSIPIPTCAGGPSLRGLTSNQWPRPGKPLVCCEENGICYENQPLTEFPKESAIFDFNSTHWKNLVRNIHVRTKRQTTSCSGACSLPSEITVCPTNTSILFPLSGISITRQSRVNIAQYPPVFIQPVIYNRCLKTDCQMLGGKCSQVLVPQALFIYIQKDEKIVTELDFVFVEGGCQCTPNLGGNLQGLTIGVDPILSTVFRAVTGRILDFTKLQAHLNSSQVVTSFPTSTLPGPIPRIGISIKATQVNTTLAQSKQSSPINTTETSQGRRAVAMNDEELDFQTAIQDDLDENDNELEPPELLNQDFEFEVSHSQSDLSNSPAYSDDSEGSENVDSPSPDCVEVHEEEGDSDAEIKAFPPAYNNLDLDFSDSESLTNSESLALNSEGMDEHNDLQHFALGEDSSDSADLEHFELNNDSPDSHNLQLNDDYTDSNLESSHRESPFLDPEGLNQAAESFQSDLEESNDSNASGPSERSEEASLEELSVFQIDEENSQTDFSESLLDSDDLESAIFPKSLSLHSNIIKAEHVHTDSEIDDPPLSVFSFESSSTSEPLLPEFADIDLEPDHFSFELEKSILDTSDFMLGADQEPISFSETTDSVVTGQRSNLTAAPKAEDTVKKDVGQNQNQISALFNSFTHLFTKVESDSYQKIIPTVILASSPPTRPMVTTDSPPPQTQLPKPIQLLPAESLPCTNCPILIPPKFFDPIKSLLSKHL